MENINNLTEDLADFIATPFTEAEDVRLALKKATAFFERIEREEKRINSLRNNLNTKVRRLKFRLNDLSSKYPVYDEVGDYILRITNVTESGVFLKYDGQTNPVEYSLEGLRKDGKSEYRIDSAKAIKKWQKFVLESEKEI